MKTIRFLPDRLNADPVVFRGFTTPEMGLAGLIGIGIGLIWSFPLITLIGWVIVPTGMLLTPLILIAFCGRWLARLKRGKPENYIWQRLAIKRHQFGLGNLSLITVSQRWSMKRSPKGLKTNPRFGR
ncbi:hypothetical protein BS639_24080 [Rouxiella silvae]|jgi:conjugative transfer region protein (TIGR03750 family)|uniref:TIGR03750 family conjugal transfer protein n=1 Tax=Rouxiella silvae TaxID=1646373 RepID=A0ABX3TTW7_9GAMM|nr:TIGR03750 family conjugal transfer protein [Rouxiella silvae]ORJ18661.1 hypothetical protein BS639_24080 [Rouxiella silvae]